MCVYEDTLQGPSSYISGWLAQSLHKICLPLVSFWSFKARTQAGMYADLGEKKWIWTRKKFLQCGLFPPSPLKFRNEGWVKNIGAHLRQAGVKAPIYWENKESGRKYFRPVKQNISVPWNRIFLSSGKYPVEEKKMPHDEKCICSGKLHFRFVAVRIFILWQKFCLN